MLEMRSKIQSSLCRCCWERKHHKVRHCINIRDDFLPLKTLSILKNISHCLGIWQAESIFITQPCCLLQNRVTIRTLACTELFAKPIYTVSSVSLNWIRIVKLFTRQWAVFPWLACVFNRAAECDLNGKHWVGQKWARARSRAQSVSV